MIRKKRCTSPQVYPLFLKSALILTAFLLSLPAVAWAGITVTLQWDQTDTANLQYKIFCRRDGGTYDYTRPAWVGDSKACTITMERGGSGEYLEENVEYYFVARAVDRNGNESADSNEVFFCHRVEATGGGGQNDGSGASTDPNPPEQPAPSNGGDNNGTGASSAPTTLTPLLSTTGYHDVNTEDEHTRSQWQIYRSEDNMCVFDYTSEQQLTEIRVPQLILEADTEYYWIVRFYNNRDGVSQWSEPARFTTGHNSEDANGNGVPDGQEINWITDLDQDGTDDSTQEHIKCVNLMETNAQMGISTVDSDTVFSLEAVEAIPTEGNSSRSANQQHTPEALVAFKLLVAQPGDTAYIRVHLSEPLLLGMTWYHYNADEKYQECADTVQISEDRMSVTLEIQDGGFGDSDGVANGIIVARSGYGAAGQDMATGASSSGGGYSIANELKSCFIQSLLY